MLAETRLEQRCGVGEGRASREVEDARGGATLREDEDTRAEQLAPHLLVESGESSILRAL